MQIRSKLESCQARPEEWREDLGLEDAVQVIVVNVSLTHPAAAGAAATRTVAAVHRLVYAPKAGSQILNPWVSITPGTAIAMVVLSFNLKDDGVRDALALRLQRKDM